MELHSVCWHITIHLLLHAEQVLQLRYVLHLLQIVLPTLHLNLIVLQFGNVLDGVVGVDVAAWLHGQLLLELLLLVDLGDGELQVLVQYGLQGWIILYVGLQELIRVLRSVAHGLVHALIKLPPTTTLYLLRRALIQIR